jgi:hypothetical protein
MFVQGTPKAPFGVLGFRDVLWVLTSHRSAAGLMVSMAVVTLLSNQKPSCMRLSRCFAALFGCCGQSSPDAD